MPCEVLDWQGLTFSVYPYTHPQHTQFIFTWNECASSALSRCWALADTICLLAKLPMTSASETSDKLAPMLLSGKEGVGVCVCVCVCSMCVCVCTGEN